VALNKGGLLVMRMQTLRWTELLQQLEVTTDYHWQPCRQSSSWWSLPWPCWCVLVAAVTKWFCGATFNLLVVLGFCYSLVYYTILAWHVRRDSPVV